LPVRRSLVALLAVVTVLAACARSPLPTRLAGLRRTRVWSGERAARMIARLHGKRVAPASSFVADYGTGGELRVYLASFTDAAEASRTLERMLAGMSSGSSPFSSPRPERGGSGRWLAFGPGGHNELWVSDGRLYWLQGLPAAVQDAAAELPAPVAGIWT
jgi:hypothetical protein